MLVKSRTKPQGLTARGGSTVLGVLQDAPVVLGGALTGPVCGTALGCLRGCVDDTYLRTSGDGREALRGGEPGPGDCDEWQRGGEPHCGGRLGCLLLDSCVVWRGGWSLGRYRRRRKERSGLMMPSVDMSEGMYSKERFVYILRTTCTTRCVFHTSPHVPFAPLDHTLRFDPRLPRADSVARYCVR